VVGGGTKAFVVGEYWKEEVDEFEDAEDASEKTEPESEPLLEESESWDRRWKCSWGTIMGDTGDGSGEKAGIYSGAQKLGPCASWAYCTGEYGGVTGRLGEVEVNRGQRYIRSRKVAREILLVGSNSKTRLRMPFSSSEMGRMLFRKLRSLTYARKVESSREARFHGLRPQVRFTKMTPSDQTSLGAEA
jgi:hypothetical protein